MIRNHILNTLHRLLLVLQWHHLNNRCLISERVDYSWHHLSMSRVFDDHRAGSCEWFVLMAAMSFPSCYNSLTIFFEVPFFIC
jgi:hypothetical protein